MTATEAPPAVDDLEYLTVRQIAERLKVTTKTVRAWMNEGPMNRRLPYLQFDRAVRVSRRELNQWLAERRRSHRIDNADRAIS